MATPFQFTLRQERVLDGDLFGLRLLLESQQPIGAIPGRGSFVFECTGINTESFVGIARLSDLAGAGSLELNSYDTVVFSEAHGFHPGDELTFSGIPARWASLEDQQLGTSAPTITRIVDTSVTPTELRVTEPFWTAEPLVYVRKASESGATPVAVSVQRRLNEVGTRYRAERYYFAYENVTESINTALLVEAELDALLKRIAEERGEYTRRTNPQVTYISLNGGPPVRYAGPWESNLSLSDDVGGGTSTGSGSGTLTSVTGGIGLGGGTITTAGTLYVKYGASSGTACEGNDIRLSDARTPSSHAATHYAGGADALTPAAIGALADVTPGTAGNVLTSDGTTWVSSPVARSVPEIRQGCAFNITTQEQAPSAQVVGVIPFNGPVYADKSVDFECAGYTSASSGVTLAVRLWDLTTDALVASVSLTGVAPARASVTLPSGTGDTLYELRATLTSGGAGSSGTVQYAGFRIY